MTENEKEVTETLKTVVNHPIYSEFTKSEIPKLAQKKLELSHIARVHGLKLENIFRGHSHDFWLIFVDKITKHHRSQFGDTYLPNPLPSGARKMTAEMLTKKHEKKVDDHFQKLKNKHDKLEKEIKSSVKKRI
jgi:hypothetical protein